MLIDTSTLLRTIQVRHPQYETVARAFETLPRRGRDLHIVPQNLVELWVVATRPVAQNGLGLSTTEAAAELKPAHDARLVAAMHVHGLTTILTFDRTGFSRYAGIEVLHPADAAT